ncbi:hypothetical protein [Acinetobacter sp.]|uniref:hypothetical protein n=1 Tax=Acinetobacter sp. TaxID=472 RepID=UPI00290E6405|nr:hypothetical protein [Acinetobacter sp.]MDU5771903.1 hypothetical protein [Acinetobacter sp.]
MEYIIYVLALLGVIFLFALLWILKITIQAKRDIRSKPRTFRNANELINFIRTVFKCELKHNSILFGFVESTYRNNGLEGLSDPHLEVDVSVLLENGNRKIEATCPLENADLVRGDFVAILPIYNQRHDIWSYVVVSKLKAIYLGKKGFQVVDRFVEIE